MRRADGLPALLMRAASLARNTPCCQASFTRDMAAAASAHSSDLAALLRDREIPGHFQKSFCTHLGLMHSELSWRCRLHPNVKTVYSALYETDELVTGVDNVFFTQVLVPHSATPPPSSTRGYTFFTERFPLHFGSPA
jgi:hypothetical protein